MPELVRKDESMEEGFSASNVCRALKRSKQLAFFWAALTAELEAMWGVSENQISVKEFSNRAVQQCNGPPWKAVSFLRGKQAGARQTWCNKLLWGNTFFFLTRFWNHLSNLLFKKDIR